MTVIESLARGCPPRVAARRLRMDESEVLRLAKQAGWPDLYELETAARAARGEPPIEPENHVDVLSACESAVQLRSITDVAGWGAERIAKELGMCSSSTVRRIRNGRYRTVSQPIADAIAALAKQCGVM